MEKVVLASENLSRLANGMRSTRSLVKIHNKKPNPLVPLILSIYDITKIVFYNDQ